MIEIKMKVELGVSEELRGLVRDMLGNHALVAADADGDRALEARYRTPGRSGQADAGTEAEDALTSCAPQSGTEPEPEAAASDGEPGADADGNRALEARHKTPGSAGQEAADAGQGEAATVSAGQEAADAGQGEAAVEPPTKEVMKTMMDIAISRFAGNGWQETKDPKVIRIQRECTKAFKEIARHLGAEKPTALVGDKRTEFLRELDNIYMTGDGVEWRAF